MTKFGKELATFLEISVPAYKPIYATSQTDVSCFNRFLILDSSFNPPHKGHLALITRYLSLQQDPKDLAVILLLSVQNADKHDMKPASFEQRLEMMVLLANYIEKETGLAVVIGLTNQARFADKSKLIWKWLKSAGASDATESIFLVGFDTLIRIFNSKYYAPLSIRDALHEFMSNNYIFSLTRDGDKEFPTHLQLDFVDRIRQNEVEGIPSEWWSKIQLADDNNDEVLKISSSRIRAKILQNDNGWEKDTTKNIADYIIKERLYLD